MPSSLKTVNQSTCAKRFVVSIHDVTPSSLDQLAQIIGALQPRVGTMISAAVIPAGFERSRGARLAALVHSDCREIALHGYSHQGQRRYHPLALLTRNALEFHGLSSLEIQRRLQRGQKVLREVFGHAASVVIPPAWCRGPLTPMIAESCDCPVIVALTSLETRTIKCPLAVFSWDWGRFAALGRVGEVLGRILWRLRSAIPVVVVHPCDASRNLFVRALAIVDRLLVDGFSPITFAELACHSPEPLRKGLY